MSLFFKMINTFESSCKINLLTGITCYIIMAKTYIIFGSSQYNNGYLKRCKLQNFSLTLNNFNNSFANSCYFCHKLK